ncbi:hypothetical protein F4803DRAFT_566232 [Xylaria telfairii]|nr:hypothetical protein F4803DRAFT_566232 [Xylaria telfairii]
MMQDFMKYWRTTTADNSLTLHGFRRFKTTYLLNLRFLEGEIATLNHTIYQAALGLGLGPSSSDRHEALIAFNHIMTMETFSLLDDERQSSLRTELSLYEIYNTRLVRTDLGVRFRTDPFQRRLHKYLRDFRYWQHLKSNRKDSKAPGVITKPRKWDYQNTILIAEVAGRIITAVTTGVFLIVPLVIIIHKSKDIQVAIVSVFIMVFSFVVTAALKVSSLEMMALSAAYATVLATFVSGGH